MPPKILPKLPTSPEFESAADAVFNLPTKPSDEKLLEFYGLYKFGCYGKNPEGAGIATWGKPYYKWKAWDDVSKRGITPDEAQAEYVERYEALKRGK